MPWRQCNLKVIERATCTCTCRWQYTWVRDHLCPLIRALKGMGFKVSVLHLKSLKNLCRQYVLAVATNCESVCPTFNIAHQRVLSYQFYIIWVHSYGVDLPVLFEHVYCCSVAPALSLSEHDDASEMAGGHECSAISSWRALPGKESSAPDLHLNLCLHLQWNVITIIGQVPF